jgi:hypothetical protein
MVLKGLEYITLPREFLKSNMAESAVKELDEENG